ncbi:C163A protein, partial [Crypturellus undulatus]|nr:C163A protein [Crypturellus undulatus]
ELRLVNGAGPCEGRVEVKLRGQWGTIAENQWDMEDSEVVCQQLGCGSAISAHIYTPFGQGSGPVHFVGIDCHGNESALWECRITGWGSYKGYHHLDVGVICQGFVRLVGGDSTCSGRVEVRQGQEWATLCQTHMDLNTANVICKELGCGAALAVTSAAHFGSGVGPIWDGGFECTGNESLLSDFTRRQPHGQGCTHANDTGIICSRKSTGRHVRLASGPGRCAGRVEVYMQGAWRRVCKDNWDLWDAAVVCRQLGCGRALAVPHSAHYGQGSGSVWLGTGGCPYFCSSTETALHECQHLGSGQHHCDHDTDVGVTCSGAVEVRLANGAGPREGRVEAKLRGQWETAADNEWDMEDSEMVCQQLGCSSAKSVHSSTSFGEGFGPTQLVRMDCRGNESALWECPILRWGPFKGAHNWDLPSGDGTRSGRVEVRQGQEWATFCEAHMVLSIAKIICKELGCGAALAVTSAAHFGSGAGPIWDGGFECAGNEYLLSACACRLPHGQGCTHANNTCIICSLGWTQGYHVPLPFSLPRKNTFTDFRLVNCSTACAGRVAMEVRGTWRSLCNTSWDECDAQVLYHQLGCGFLTSVPRGGYFGSGSGLLWRDTFNCRGIKSHLGACPAIALGIPECSPHSTAGVNFSGRLWREGMQGPAGPKHPPLPALSLSEESWQVQLLRGPRHNAGRVEVYVQGAWSRVCEDNWDLWDATAVCRQLGCGRALAAPGSAHYGQGSGPVW